MPDETWASPANNVINSTVKNLGPTLSYTNASLTNYDPTEVNLPKDLAFTEGHMLTIVTYSILIVISMVANITVLIVMSKRRRKARTRINTMLMHLAIADLLVTLLLMPIDMYWAYTVRWVAGDLMCRLGAFSKIFGLYLSSFVIICISVDRYLAVLKPMNLYQVDRRGKFMLTTAWVASFICSVPQVFIFHVEKHPKYPTFEQCVTWNSFPNKFQELCYLYSGMFIMYLLPLAVVVFCYSSIVLEVFRRSQNANLGCIRRSGLGFLGRARSRTLKMTIIMVMAFLICWTPYYVMCVWFWIDEETAKSVDYRIQRALFLFASTNSCMNPIVYGIFNIRPHRSIQAQSRAHTYTGRISYATDIRLPALTLSLRSVE